jgi:hypothetical protein
MLFLSFKFPTEMMTVGSKLGISWMEAPKEAVLFGTHVFEFLAKPKQLLAIVWFI